jgi:hypothetical protein
MPNPVLGRRHRPVSYPGVASNHVAAQSQFWSIATNASLQMGASVDVTLAGWIWFDSLSNGNNVFIKARNPTTNIEYECFYQTATAKIRFDVTANGTTQVTVDTATTPVVGTWNFLVCRYDGTNISTQLNNGTLVNTAFTTDIFSTTNRFCFGSNDDSGLFHDGRLDSWGIWKSSRGNGGALSAAQLTFLYNNGYGVTYEDLPSTLKSNLVSWWKFDGNGLDSHSNANHLTNNGGCRFTQGKR